MVGLLEALGSGLAAGFRSIAGSFRASSGMETGLGRFRETGTVDDRCCGGCDFGCGCDDFGG